MANGRVYVQHNGQFGWIKDPWLLIPDGVKRCYEELIKVKPKKASDVTLTPDIRESWRFDVDNPDGYFLISDLMESGATVCIADSYHEGKPPKPGVSPFTPNP